MNKKFATIVSLLSIMVVVPHTCRSLFVLEYLKTFIGVMITASHNPKNDNGYKLYWENAAQITAPHNVLISQFILKSLVPWENNWWEYAFSSTFLDNELIVDCEQEMNISYLEMVAIDVIFIIRNEK